MDQNQTTDNQSASVDNDLQKAIDNITNTTNVDPVFSDPVAAPSSVPEGDTGELDEAVGPFPEPPKVEMPTAPAGEPIAPLEAMNIPEINNFDANAIPVAEETQIVEQVSAPEPATESLSTSEVKKAALRDLLPLLSKLNINKSQKFNIYKDIFEELKDYTVLEPAYQAARDLDDETERANALLYVVEAIDKM